MAKFAALLPAAAGTAAGTLGAGTAAATASSIAGGLGASLAPVAGTIGSTVATAGTASLAAPIAGGIGLSSLLSSASDVAGLIGGVQGFAQSGVQADIARQQAANQANINAINEAAQRRRNKQLLSAQAAQLGKSGVQLTGTAGTFLQRSAFEQELDALSVKYTGQQSEASILSEIPGIESAGRRSLFTGLQSGATLLTS